jgi:hypothetical protein
MLVILPMLGAGHFAWSPQLAHGPITAATAVVSTSHRRECQVNRVLSGVGIIRSITDFVTPLVFAGDHRAVRFFLVLGLGLQAILES